MKALALAIITILAGILGATLRWYFDQEDKQPMKDFEYKKLKIKDKIAEVEKRPASEITDEEVDSVIDNFINMVKSQEDE